MNKAILPHIIWLVAAVAAFAIGRTTVSSKQETAEAPPATKSTAGKRLPGDGSGGARRGAEGSEAENQRGSSAAGALEGSSNPRVTVGAYLREPDPLKANRMFADLLLNLDAANAREVFDSLRESGRDGMQFGQQMGLFLEAWGKLDGAAAIAAAGELGNDPRRRGFATMSAMTGWAAVDPAGAKAHLDSMESSEGWEKGMLVQGLISGMARKDPSGATDYVFEMEAERQARIDAGEDPGDDRWRGYAVDRQMESIANVLMAQGITEATAWAEGLPEGSLKSSAFDRVAEDYARQDPVAAADWVTRHADQEWAGRAVREVAEEYSRNDPEAAVEWAGALPEQHQASALSESFERWTREDAVAAGEYLTGMSDGTARDAAVSSFARELDRNDPQTAAQWAASIGDEGVRTETLESVARSWMRTNKDEAQAWLPNSGLAPEMQERIVADAERGGDRRGDWGGRGR